MWYSMLLPGNWNALLGTVCVKLLAVIFCGSKGFFGESTKHSQKYAFHESLCPLTPANMGDRCTFISWSNLNHKWMQFAGDAPSWAHKIGTITHGESVLLISLLPSPFVSESNSIHLQPSELICQVRQSVILWEPHDVPGRFHWLNLSLVLQVGSTSTPPSPPSKHVM